MTLVAFGLILAAAFFHASWNLLAKRASDGGVAFVFLVQTMAALIYAPFAIGIIIFQQPYLGPAEVLFIGGSTLLHLAYFLMLQQGYKIGDLSVVYPLARGTGPTLSTIAAIAFFGERPGYLALAGALLVGVGVAVLTGNRSTLRSPNGGTAILFGLTIGTIIAGYTLWDKHAVSTLMIPPLILDWMNNAGRSVLLSGYALRNRARIGSVWTSYRGEILGAAILSPLAYILVLSALVFTPVSYVAPAREISILIGVAMGSRLLSEGDSVRRLSAAGVMVIGILALALG